MRIHESALPNILSKLKSVPEQYAKLTIERKAKVFNGKALTKIESAYRGFQNFITELESNKGSIYRRTVEGVLSTTADALLLVYANRSG